MNKILLYTLISCLVHTSCNTEEPTRKFNKEKWFEDKENRHEMTNYLLKKEMLLNKSKTEIIELIGKESNEYSDNTWSYNLGGSIPDYLRLNFVNDNCSRSLY